MGLISISDIRPGMVLAADVRDRNNRVLLAAGQEINEKHVKIFKMWGVSEADVKGTTHEEVVAQAIAEVDPMTYQDAERVTLERFRHADMNHPGVRELVRLATLRQAAPKGTEARHG